VHTTPLAKIKFEDGRIGHMAAPEGISVGQNIAFGDNVSLRPGNVTTLDKIPEGTPVCNVELDQEMEVNLHVLEGILQS